MKSLLNISCLRISLCILFCLAGTSFIYTLYAQIPDRVFKTDFRIDPEKKGELSVEFDNLSFFKDDEYTGSFMKGYTLPGLWLQAKAVYYPLEMLKLEAGDVYKRQVPIRRNSFIGTLFNVIIISVEEVFEPACLHQSFFEKQDS